MNRTTATWIALGLLLTVLVGQPNAVLGQEGEPVVTQDEDAEEDMPALDEEGSGIEVPDVDDADAFRDWLLSLDQKERDTLFMQEKPGPKPKGLYTGFMLSDRPNYEDFDISLPDKTVMTFVFDRWIGKVFDGKGYLRNVLRDESGFTPADLAGKIYIGESFLDDGDSWIAEYPEDSAYGFIIDEFRQIKPGYLFGRTYVVPPKKGDKTFFECGLVRITSKVPKEEQATQMLLDAASESEAEAEAEAPAEKDEKKKKGKKEDEGESEAESEAVQEGEEWEEEEGASEEPVVTAQQGEANMPAVEDEASEEMEDEMDDEMD